MKNIKKAMANFFQLVLKVITNSHGIFSFSRASSNNQIAKYYKEVFCKKGGGSFRTDKENLRSDFRA